MYSICPSKTHALEMVRDKPCNYLGPCHVRELLGIKWFEHARTTIQRKGQIIAHVTTSHLKRMQNLLGQFRLHVLHSGEKL